MHKIWPGGRAHWVKYENINNSDLDVMSLASFCRSKAIYIEPWGAWETTSLGKTCHSNPHSQTAIIYLLSLLFPLLILISGIAQTDIFYAITG